MLEPGLKSRLRSGLVTLGYEKPEYEKVRVRNAYRIPPRDSGLSLVGPFGQQPNAYVFGH